MIFSVLIIIVVFACLTSVYSSASQEKLDNIIKIDNIEFNTTADSNITQFKLFNDTKYDDGSYCKQYVDPNFGGYNVFIWNLSTADDWDNFTNHVKKGYDDKSYETINGIQIYSVSAAQGNHAGEQRFQSYVFNKDLKTIVEFSTPTPHETVKIASSLKFR